MILFISPFIGEETTIITTRLILAFFLGGIIGAEREYNKHPAGFRTHLLVCVGSCLIMLLSMFGFQEYMQHNKEYVNFDPSRLAAYVVSGIGFLGAGTIIVQGYTVRGLTTAASIWVVAGIGLSIGVGMYYAGLLTTIIVVLSLMVLSKVDTAFTKKTKQYESIVIHAKAEDTTLLDMIKIFEINNVTVKKIMVEREKKKRHESDTLLRYQMRVVYPNKEAKITIIEKLYKISQVDKVYSL